MSPLQKLASEFNVVISILVLGIFAWKAAEMAFKERYSMMWGLLLAGALVGGFLFAGQSTFTWLWKVMCTIVGGCD